MEMMGSEMDDEAIEVRDHKLLGLSVPLARGEPGDTQSATCSAPRWLFPDLETQSGVRAQEVFKHIDEDCGGTIDTDEFTQVRF